ncbi:NADH-quinone oxidoreductase subunit A [Candidatus Poribacteria bacterium]|nr:NADH-quinone oxidoreductase subunit A [Candidatus Poribacteria bacterium]MYB63776.1 NADH-quinone oxidoreductase subunit A [Candidatus Poribacteria bacterium]MYF57063.1 NADH-quinone oxidoreductase subunit A [Candidatus Poribacteria bacterium]
MLMDYLPIVFLGLFAVLFAGVNLGLTHLLGPKKPTKVKLSVYESGVQPVGDARQRFTIRFDLIAMLFIIFDIEVVFLYPWAVVFKRFSADNGMFILVEMLVFIGILLLGYIYAWKKGGLTWD